MAPMPATDANISVVRLSRFSEAVGRIIREKKSPRLTATASMPPNASIQSLRNPINLDMARQSYLIVYWT